MNHSETVRREHGKDEYRLYEAALAIEQLMMKDTRINSYAIHDGIVSNA